MLVAFNASRRLSAQGLFSKPPLELIRQRGAAKAAGNHWLMSELAKRCREAIKKILKRKEQNHVRLPPCNERIDDYVAPNVLPSEIRHAMSSVRNRTAPGPDRIRPEHLKNLPPVIIKTLARLFTRYLYECFQVSGKLSGPR
ncbi:hypothetical protein DICVIV_13578 [Dictyocaulus viviparus]|uniref:Reverse transcriptase domain-containing protein n=1 Tax=Dictyocaulus viviparus TaxID=29172 RepID=A0A0D8X7F3_DICVI|nr:hypothetical protein DICVIV_13578 [Dictyocaulus viviparus]